MGARAESPGSAPAGRPVDLIEAAAGGAGDRGRISACLGRLPDDERREAVEAAAELPGGLRALVDLRHHVMAHRGADPHLGALQSALRDVLQRHFALDLLEFEVIGGDASDDLLDRLTRCEAVHPIQSRADLIRRLAPADRRGFALTHPAMADDPVVFVEVALTAGLAASVQTILDPDTPALDPSMSDTATFYSINNCQPGLRGIPFGAELLRRVMDVLSETTSVTTFATLSPIPGFARWLGEDPPGDEVGQLRACARYLLTAKRRDHPLDPVARFHLGSGARLERLNPGGDVSPRGMRRYLGITANYLYDRDHLVARQTAYRRGEVVASPSVASLLCES